MKGDARTFVEFESQHDVIVSAEVYGNAICRK